jgi:SnoaL-like protein
MLASKIVRSHLKIGRSDESFGQDAGACGPKANIDIEHYRRKSSTILADTGSALHAGVTTPRGATMPFTGPLEDRLLIRELYDRYTDACWRCDGDEWLSCFAENARWTTHLFDCSGKDEMRETWDRIAADWLKVVFLSEIGSIEVSGATAKARSYTYEIIDLKSRGLVKPAARYEDSLIREDGAWLFASRTYHPIFVEAPE